MAQRTRTEFLFSCVLLSLLFELEEPKPLQASMNGVLSLAFIEIQVSSVFIFESRGRRISGRSVVWSDCQRATAFLTCLFVLARIPSSFPRNLNTLPDSNIPSVPRISHGCTTNFSFPSSDVTRRSEDYAGVMTSPHSFVFMNNDF